MFNDQLDRATLLEMTRLRSINFQSQLVLCTNFLPWLDLALSADSEGQIPPLDGRSHVELRWLEVVGFLADAIETQKSATKQCTMLASFGLLRCWHVRSRVGFLKGHGPIWHIVDGGQWFKKAGWPA